MTKEGKMKMYNVFKFSAVTGAGTVFGIIPQFLVGILIFLSGLYLKKNATGDFQYYTGLLFMIIGCAFGLGFGQYILISELFNE